MPPFFTPTTRYIDPSRSMPKTPAYDSRGTQTLPEWDCSIIWSTASSDVSSIITSVASEENPRGPPPTEATCAEEEKVSEAKYVLHEGPEKYIGQERKDSVKERRNELWKSVERRMRKDMKKMRRFGRAVFESFVCGYVGRYGR